MSLAAALAARDTDQATSKASTLAGDNLSEHKTIDLTSPANEPEIHDEKTQDGASSPKLSSVHTPEDEDEYPTGIKMFFIVLALVLSIFLLSLDMVCAWPSDHHSQILDLGLYDRSPHRWLTSH